MDEKMDSPLAGIETFSWSHGGMEADGDYVLLSDVMAALQARASLPVGVPDGYALVPVALTEEMRQAFNRVDVLRYPENNRQLFKAKHSWAAILAAAPSAPAGEAVPVDGDLTRVKCPCCPYEYEKDSYDAGFIAGSGMCQVCDAAMPAKDLPAAGVEEVERFTPVSLGDNIPRMNPCDTGDWMRAAQHNRIVAQLVGGDSVSVPSEMMEAAAVVEYTGYEPANSLRWLNKGLAYMEPGTLLYAQQQSSITTAIERREKEHGSLRAAAQAIGVDPGYLSRLKSGEKLNPSDEVLAALGLERVVAYRALLSRNGNGGE